jgi:hypothetical protein
MLKLDYAASSAVYLLPPLNPAMTSFFRYLHLPSLIRTLIRRIKSFNQPVVTMTHYGCMFGAHFVLCVLTIATNQWRLEIELV